MSDEIKVNRPAPAMNSTMPTQPMYQEAPKASKMPWIVLGVVVVVLIVVGVLFRDKLFASKAAVKGSSTVAMSGSGYQAVFLSNGQVYFGKIKSQSDEYVTLSDIYYLQVIQPPLQGSGQNAQAAPQAEQQPQISLVKLGNELHGPVDEMHISRSQVLFYEDLKEDGSVVKAIRNYQANPAK